MTRSEVVMFDPVDVVAIVIQCTACHTRVHTLLDKWQTGVRQCPGCGKRGLGNSLVGEAVNTLVEALERVQKGAPDNPFIISFEIAGAGRPS